jgi:acyl-CoA synthetase (AMP-forming)/AMP-acid ligase II
MELTRLLHDAVARHPQRVAVVCGQRRRTFAELQDRVARLAGGLHQLGVAPGDRVAMLSQNSDSYHEYYFAVPWADAVLNPVNTRWNPTEIAYSLRDSATRVLIVDPVFTPLVEAIRENHSELTTVIVTGRAPAPDGTHDYESLVASARPVPDARRGGDELAGVFYTGGTTGFPKGVMLSHRNLLVSAAGTMSTGAMHTPDGTALHSAPMFHLAALATWINQNMAANTQVYLPRFDPKEVLDAIQRHAVTDIVLVPTMIQMLVDHPAIHDFTVSSVKRVLYGGSSIAASVLSRAMATFPQAQFTQAFGMTELGPVATLLLPEDHILDGEGSHRLTSAGRAAPHAEVRIVDEDDREVPVGEIGQIVVRGANVTAGYWDNPAETAQALRGGWMHTGDAGRLDEAGYLYIVDRIKDMIVTGGENVYSTEVENAVAQHPAVAAVAVIGLPDEVWGERVHAVVVLHRGASATAEDICSHTKSLIARYKAPRSVDFVEALPTSGAGKVLKRSLRERYVTAVDYHKRALPTKES